MNRWCVALLLIAAVLALSAVPVEAKRKKDKEPGNSAAAADDAAAKRKLAERLKEASASAGSGSGSGSGSDAAAVKASAAAADRERARKAADDKLRADKAKAAAAAPSRSDEKLKKRRAKLAKRARKRRARRADRIAKSLARARRTNKTLAAARADRKKRASQLASRRYKRAAKLSEKLRAAAHKTNRAKANEKLRKLHELTAASNTGVLSFNTDQYKEFVMSGPRPYFLFFALTALHAGYRCQYCHQLHDTFTTLAPAFTVQHNLRLPRTIEGGSSGGLTPALAGAEGETDVDDNSGELPGTGTSRITAGVATVPAVGEDGGASSSLVPTNTSRDAGFWNGWWWVNAAEEGNAAKRESFRTYPVFFVEVDIARNQDLFNALNLKTAPLGVVLPPKLTPSFTSGTAGLSGAKLAQWFNAIDKKYHFQQASASIGTDEVHGFVSKWTTVRVDLTPPIAWMNLVWLVLAGVSACAFLWYAWVPLSRLRGLALVCCLMGLAFYTFCIGGGMYNFIRDIPFSEQHKDGSVSYIYYTARDQLGAEGYIMGFLQIVCGLCTVFAIRNARTPPTSGTGAGSSSSGSRGSKKVAGVVVPSSGPIGLLPASVVRGPLFFAFELPAAAYVGALVLCWYSLVHIYSLKNGGYRHGWLFDGITDWM